RGKSRQNHIVNLSDRRLAHLIRRCEELPGQELFQYLDDESRACPIDSADVNDYLRSISGEDFTAKDFRTWAGTVLAVEFLRKQTRGGSPARARRKVNAAIVCVAAELRNTVAICRKC